MSTSRRDAIVIGAGQNGLAAATRLAAAGLGVLVLEGRESVGGLCGARSLGDATVPGVLHDEGLVSPRIARALGLERHGLGFVDPPPVLLAESGRGLALYRDPQLAAPELAARSARDAEAYGRMRAFLGRIAPLVDRLLSSAPPPLSPGLGDLGALVRTGVAALRLGRKDTLELMRVAPMCVADFLNEQFETPLLVEGLAAPAVIGTFAGPWSAGTTTNLLLAEARAGRHVAGGPAGLVTALERAARAAGAEIRTAARVTRILVESGRATGVELASGEILEASVVLGSSDPKRTFLDLVPPGTLPIRIEEEYARIRMRGTAAKLHLVLSGPLELAARPGERFAAIRIGGGHVDDLERAFDAVKYRSASARPHLEIRVPTVADPSLAPRDHEVLSILVSYVPHDPPHRWPSDARDALQDSVLAILEQHAPGIRRQIVASELLTPADLESEYALTGGQLHHGEPALDQLLVMRPAPSAARYVTSLPGLYLGGSGSHGGGGVGCTAGWLAAGAALRDRR